MNVRKLIDEDPQFRQFCQTIIFQVMLKSQPDFMQLLWSFYQSDMSPEQAIQLLLLNNKLGGMKS